MSEGFPMSPELSENDEWLDERLCKCERFIYPSDEDYNWEQELSLMLRPPYCRTCNGWANRVQMCVRCSQNYYQFFWHPLMGWHASLGKYGWECWDCLEVFKRDVVNPYTGRKVPPPALVISPFHVKLVKPPLSAESQVIWDNFDRLLDEI
jgi:hypothetical protein